MSLLLDPFPSAEKLAAAVLRTMPARAYSSVPAKAGLAPHEWPLLVVRRIGGIPAVKVRLDRASLQVESWGANKGQALDLAHAARVTLLSMKGRYLEAGGFEVDADVTGVDDSLGLAFIPDPVTGRDRYIFGVEVFLHSA